MKKIVQITVVPGYQNEHGDVEEPYLLGLDSNGDVFISDPAGTEWKIYIQSQHKKAEKRN